MTTKIGKKKISVKLTDTKCEHHNATKSKVE